MMRRRIRACVLLLLLLAVAVPDASAQERDKKAIFVLVDGISADVLERLPTPHLDRIAAVGGYTRAYVGGERGGYSETPTISAPGYNTMLTGTWANKHNVWDNAIEAPNYRYWTIFRLLKHRHPEKRTAIFSTWLENRTKLVGEARPETDGFLFDYHFDGLERDTLTFPRGNRGASTRRIDALAAAAAAAYVRDFGPHLTWVYLQYPDDVGHHFGEGDEMAEAVRLADAQIGGIWDAVQQRAERADEDWLVVVTTDHGRREDGFGHGGQSDRERRTWIVTNAADTNAYFETTPAMVDILPTIARFMGIAIPKNVAMELDGVPFIGDIAASNFVATRDGSDALRLRWKAWTREGRARVWLATTNAYREGGLDTYRLVGEVEVAAEEATIPLNGLAGDFFKVVLETPDGRYLNYWIVEAGQ